MRTDQLIQTLNKGHTDTETVQQSHKSTLFHHERKEALKQKLKKKSTTRDCLFTTVLNKSQLTNTISKLKDISTNPF